MASHHRKLKCLFKDLFSAFGTFHFQIHFLELKLLYLKTSLVQILALHRAGGGKPLSETIYASLGLMGLTSARLAIIWASDDHLIYSMLLKSVAIQIGSPSKRCACECRCIGLLIVQAITLTITAMCQFGPRIESNFNLNR